MLRHMAVAAVLIGLAFGPAKAEEVSAGSAEALDLGRYHALVIGNDEYRYMPNLETAVADAKAVAALLKQHYDFKVTLLLNADRKTLLATMNELRGRLETDDNLLIYYAGHGTLDRQSRTGFWLPVDAAVEDDINWIPVDTLTRHLRAMLPRHVMVIADSCYSGTLVRSVPAKVRTGRENLAWLKRMSKRRSRTAIVSGGLEPVSDGGRNGHSVFANALLAALKQNKGMMDGQTLFLQISRPVALNADQTPRYSDVRRADHEGGDFIFAARGAHSLKVAGEKSQSDPITKPGMMEKMELAYWQSVQHSQSVESFELFLEQFPNGTFAGLVRKKIEELKGANSILKLASAPAPTAVAAVPETLTVTATPTEPGPKSIEAVAQPEPMTVKPTLEPKLALRRPGLPANGRKKWVGSTLDCVLDISRRGSWVRVRLELDGIGSEKATFWYEDVWGDQDSLQGKNPRWEGSDRLSFDFNDIKSNITFELAGSNSNALVLENGATDSDCKMKLDLEN